MSKYGPLSVKYVYEKKQERENMHADVYIQAYVIFFFFWRETKKQKLFWKE